MKKLLVKSILCFVFGSAGSNLLASGESPNFLVILTDDQSWVGTSTLMDPENPDSKSDYYETPQMDRLMESGMRFSRGYSSTYCVPTRRALQVGQTSARHHFSALPEKQWTKRYLEQPTIPRILKAVNPDYQTAHLGKWHLKGKDPEPESLGYDVSDGYTTNDEGHVDSTMKGVKETPNITDDPKKIFDLSKRGCEFMEKQVAAGKPFYLQVSEYAVHLKIEYRQSTYDEVAGEAKGEKHTLPEFRSMIEDMDEGIGILLDKVEALGIRDNTYIIFLSDNGGRGKMPITGQEAYVSPKGQERNYPLAAAKHSVYEGGIRVPFSITGPGIEPGSTSSVPVSIVDIFPTIADLAGYSGDLGSAVDGGSFAPLARQKSDMVKRANPFFVVHAKGGIPRNSNLGRRVKFPHKSCLIQGNDKLIKFWGETLEDDVVELYDLENDIGESDNLVTTNVEKAKRLEALLNNYVEETEAALRK